MRLGDRWRPRNPREASLMASTEPIETTWRDAAVLSFQYHRLLAKRAVAQVSDEALHQSLDVETNSIAVIMQHIAGNLRSRWTEFLSSDGEKPFRQRDEEFT